MLSYLSSEAGCLNSEGDELEELFLILAFQIFHQLFVFFFGLSSLFHLSEQHFHVYQQGFELQRVLDL